ncbi:hypothetical protein [Mariniblastus fucicola]|uniref:AsmA-like C-terminal domain-containing protein n=1 Tax=Mariniblastus fucicola TaxID=980251 RepID=A0A5B9PEK8_9BACT|nr:hypothetical protein [Mariniblastus fucicola]QEG23625.1 hypothetical protein MFFC18_35260 [Mariniblastus fucicola]
MSPYRAHLYNRNQSDSEPSSLARGAWATVKLTAFLSVVGIAGWLFFQDQIQSKLGSAVENKCNLALQGTGVATSIGNAQFFDGQGMLLSNMHVKAPNVSLTAYETFLSMRSNTTDLVTGSCKVDGVEMRRVQLEVSRSPNEPFDFSVFSKLAESIEKATQGEDKQLIPIALLDSQIRIIDRTTNSEKTLSDINLRITPIDHEGRIILQYVATAASIEVQHVVLKGFLDPESGQWNVDLKLDNAAISDDLIALLPRQTQAKLGSIQMLSSRVDGSVQANGNWRTNEIRWFEGNGSVSQLSVAHKRLPSDVRNASAKFSFSPEGVTVSEIFGQMGTSPFTAHFKLSDLMQPTSWQLAGQLQDFQLDRSPNTIRAMPASAHRFLEDFQPQGEFDFQFDLSFDGTRITKTIDAYIEGLAFNFNKFPYPMTDCNGVAHWVNDQVTYELKHETRDQVMTAKGFVNNPGADATWRCDLNIEQGRLPFDDKLLAAIDANPPMAKIVRAFDARGWITGNGTLQKRTSGGDVEKRFNFDVSDMTMRHERFPYLIEGVTGSIASVNRSFRFEDLSGRSEDGKILCNGTWNPETGLNVRYLCNNIELDDRLRRALRAELKEVWDGFRPKGTVEMMTVDMTMKPDEKECNLVLDAMLNGENEGIRNSNLSIDPTWFPYELNNLAGTLVVGNGGVRLQKFKGQHGRTIVECDGDGSYSSDGWDMRLSNLLTRSLRADEPLLRALPESLARPIQYMKFNGLLNVQGTMTLASRYRKPAIQFASHAPANHAQAFNAGTRSNYPANQASYVQRASAVQPVNSGPSAPKVSMGWDLRFDMNQAEMFLGIPIENVFGWFQLIGQYDGENVECRGSVNLDSLTIYEAQITKVRGPVWFDNYQALAGGMINELSTSGTPSPSIEGEMYGGIVRLDTAISSDKEGRFVIQTTLADGNLRQLAQEFSPNLEDVEGRTFAALQMQGNASGTHTCRGSGQIHLRDAKIYELPPMMRLLKLFMPVRRINDVAFDSGDIFFEVNGENIDVKRMEFNGDTISIIGNGQMNMNHDLDLNFYSVMGRNRINIPLISDLYRRSSQKFMWINVGGTAEDPKISKEILPELNDSLRQLFQYDVP